MTIRPCIGMYRHLDDTSHPALPRLVPALVGAGAQRRDARGHQRGGHPALCRAVCAGLKFTGMMTIKR